MTPRSRIGLLLPLLGVLGLSACSGGPAPAAAPSPSPSVTVAATVPPPVPVPSCAPAGAGSARWPKGVPADLPVPPTAQMGSVQTSPDGLTLVRFTTSQSVREGVVFLARALQPAGYTLGRGDAEAIEADVPFSKGRLRGLMKMIAEQPCRTQWILALQSERATTATGAPLLPPVTSASPSPLPFG